MSKIDKKFIKSSYYIADLKLCTVRLIDNSKFPWIILIPKRKSVSDLTDLNSKDQSLLMKEIVYCSKIMKTVFKTSKQVTICPTVLPLNLYGSTCALKFEYS